MKPLSRNWSSRNRFIKHRLKLFMPVLAFSLTGKPACAQNLVPNASFESYTDCPTGISQLPKAFPWTAPPNSNADYFNACSSNAVGVPDAGDGFQHARSGNGFAGFYSFNNSGFNFREYVQAELISSLQANAYYKVSFFCSSMGTLRYATNNIGLSFSDDAVTTTGTGNVLDLPFHILKFGNPVIDDSLGWTEITGIYKAVGTEQFITIGNFSDDVNTDTLNLGNSNYPGAYYYVDDVSVEEIDQPFWTYQDHTIQYGDSVLIGPSVTGLDIDWYTESMDFIANAPGMYVKPYVNTTYIAKEDFNGVESTHEVHVTVIGNVGLAEESLNEINIYPNPSKGIFNLNVDGSIWKIEVSDISGRKIDARIENNAVDLSGFENGLYQIIFTEESNGRKVCRKVLKN